MIYNAGKHWQVILGNSFVIKDYLKNTDGCIRMESIFLISDYKSGPKISIPLIVFN